MKVAPSFTNYEIISEPFTKNGKQYVKARNSNTGKERDIRAYTEAEYTKQYPNSKQEKEDGKAAPFLMMKHARGFDKGPILVIRRNRPEDEPWLRASVARYAVGIGWYIASEDTFPDNAPEHLKYLLLSFDEFKDGDDFHMKSPEQLTKILDKKMREREWFNIK